MAFQQQFFAERDAGQHFNNFLGRYAFAVRIRHALKAAAKIRALCRSDGFENGANLRRGIDHVAGAFPALLP